MMKNGGISKLDAPTNFEMESKKNTDVNVTNQKWHYKT